MKRIGKMTPVMGIANRQEGLYLSKVDFTPSCETYEQLDVDGEIGGLVLYKQKVEFSLTGEVPEGSAIGFGMGTTIALANECPASVWLDGEAPEHTTQVITGSPYSRSREAAQECTVNGAIYPMESAAQS
jgi:hypothetical protein